MKGKDSPDQSVRASTLGKFSCLVGLGLMDSVSIYFTLIYGPPLAKRQIIMKKFLENVGTTKYGDDTKYRRLRFYISMNRFPQFWVSNGIVPGFCVVILAFATFFFPPNMAERMGNIQTWAVK